MNYKIVSWNVAGLRAVLKKDSFLDFIKNNDHDIICFQETKCEKQQVTLPDFIKEKYEYTFWKSCDGTTQRKGLNGVSIWSKVKPLNVNYNCEFDNEGRLLILEYEKFILVNVYTPNSQKYQNDRYYYRELWNKLIMNYMKNLNNKPIIFCGDFNVANEFIDIANPKAKVNKVPGFFNNEREQFKIMLQENDMIDSFRYFSKDQESTYWSNFLKQERSKVNGWRIDYFLCSKSIIDNVKKSIILKDILGSDHCPIYLEIEF